MCGIIGYFGNRNAMPILIEGLKRLEFRGYDSAGLSLLTPQLITVKKSGKVSVLEEAVKDIDSNAKIGIAHTRWATHGIPNDNNAHPHHDCKNKISVVHNGIIENYAALRETLKGKGHIFRTDTDTEVLSHLIEDFYDGNLEDSVRKALAEVEGTYGLAVISEYEKKLVAARKGSTLVFGKGDDEYFIASDVAAILGHTNKIIFLEDGDLIVISENGYSIKDVNNVQIDKKIEVIKESLEAIEKKGYSHFMLKEIFEQPESLKNCFRGRFDREKATSKLSLNFPSDFLDNLNRIILIGCGTSWHSALIGEYIIEKYSRIPVEVEYASEFRYREPVFQKGDLLVAISQSGETADTIAALKEAKELAYTLGIVNVVGSTIAREAGSGIYIHAGPEIGVASTKAFTGQIIALYLLNLFIGRSKHEISKKEGIKLMADLELIPEKIQKTLDINSEVEKIAKEYFRKNNFLYLGRGINFPVALEGALKLKEISYIHAEGYPAAEMKHGPIALIDENMPVVFLANKGNGYEKVINNMHEVKARNGKIIAIATEGDEEIKKIANHVIYVPETTEPLMPIVNVIPLQLLAYHMAVLRGHDPDKPRNLAKSVTVE